MEIFVNFNEDRITIVAHEKVTQFDCNEPSKMVDTLKTILDACGWDGNDGIELIKIDEDTRQTIWSN